MTEIKKTEVGNPKEPGAKAETRVVETKFHPHTGKAVMTTTIKRQVLELAQLGIIAMSTKGRFLPGAFRGRKKKGGREVGTCNKPKTVREILGKKGANPILVMANIMMNKKADKRLRFDCAKELATYMHGKVKSVDPVDLLDTADKKELTIYIEGAPVRGNENEDFSDVLPHEEKDVIDVTPGKEEGDGKV